MSKFYWFLGHEQFQPEDLVEHAKVAEKAGFDGVMVSEHLQPWVDDKGTSGFAFATLGAISVVTSKIQLLTGVVTPTFRYNPAIIAQAAATIDRLSSGRFELGIGTGEAINEAPLGISMPSYKEKSERIVEAIKIMKALLTGETLNFDGKYYKINNLKLYSPPKRSIPIYLAANGPQSARISAKYCDGVITSVKDVKETQENVLNQVRQDKDTNFSLITTRWSVFASNDSEAWEALQPWRGLRAPSRDTLTSPLDLQNEVDQIPKEEIMKKYTQLRTIEDVINNYSPLVSDVHADVVCFQISSVNQEETIELFGREVLPKLRKL